MNYCNRYRSRKLASIQSLTSKEVRNVEIKNIYQWKLIVDTVDGYYTQLSPKLWPHFLCQRIIHLMKCLAGKTFTLSHTKLLIVSKSQHWQETWQVNTSSSEGMDSHAYRQQLSKRIMVPNFYTANEMTTSLQRYHKLTMDKCSNHKADRSRGYITEWSTIISRKK
jgi:hypothetical protein